MPTSRYDPPTWLPISQKDYKKWIDRKAAAHVKRDRKRCEYEISIADYREKMHRAVHDHGRCDFYTGEKLDWKLIGTYCNEASAKGRSLYKAGMALLPTVDHISGEGGKYDFVICSWRTNNAKADLSYDDFVSLCERVLLHKRSKARHALNTDTTNTVTE